MSSVLLATFAAAVLIAAFAALFPKRLGRFRTLFSHEDNFSIHKIFGFSALLHYIVRFAYVGEKDMRFDSSMLTLLAIGGHAVLSLSSLIFKIPKKRIAEGSRIWPEYRLHSIIFACRSLACMLIVWAEARLELTETPFYLSNVAVVIGAMIAADTASRIVAEPSSTIQDLDAPPALRYFFSVMQFHATAGCLLGLRRFSTQFCYVWVVQFTAFLMTLRRKNLASHYPLILIYAAMLSFGLCVSTHEAMLHNAVPMAHALANGAAVGRLGLRINKYLLWMGMAVITHYSRKTTSDPESGWEDLAWIWPYAWAASVVGVLYVGVGKVAAGRARDTKKSAEEAKIDPKAVANGSGASAKQD